MTIRIISREEWGANRASLPATTMRLPAGAVYIHHSVTQPSASPGRDMQTIESIGMQRFGQFPYSYCIHPKEGIVLEGCGLRRGAHTSQRNSNSFGICWVGNYNEQNPSVQQLQSTRDLIARLVAERHLSADAPVLGHRDVYATACPGDKLYALLDAIRHPWEETPLPDDPTLPNLPDIKFFIPIVNAQTGECRGYYIVAGNGELHAFGPGAPFYGRSEVPS